MISRLSYTAEAALKSNISLGPGLYGPAAIDSYKLKFGSGHVFQVSPNGAPTLFFRHRLTIWP